jgi:hypothetical protein
MEGLRRLIQRHEKFKNYAHTAFRYPLPPAGRHFMTFVYVMIPIVSGWYVMQWAIQHSHESIGERGEHLPAYNDNEQQEVDTVQQRLVRGKHRVNADGTLTPIGGADGWGAGVNLAVSDPITQERNRTKLLQFLKQQRIKTMGKDAVADDGAINKKNDE